MLICISHATQRSRAGCGLCLLVELWDELLQLQVSLLQIMSDRGSYYARSRVLDVAHTDHEERALVNGLVQRDLFSSPRSACLL